MAGFEDLIRSTLAKRSGLTTEGRATIYQSSRTALDRMIAQNATLDEAGAQGQRDRLERAIERIEADYLAAESANTHTSDHLPQAEELPPIKPTPSIEPVAPLPPSETQTPPWRDPQQSLSDAPDAEDARADDPLASGELGSAGPPPMPRLKSDPPAVAAPSVSVDDDAAESLLSTAPSVTAAPASRDVEGDDPAQDIAGDYDGPALRERKPFARLLLWVIILAGIGTTVWWAFNFGPALLKSQLGGAVDNPPARIEAGSFVPDGQDGWVTVFEPDADAENIDTGNGGRAELVAIRGRQVARLASARSENSTVKIRVPAGLMESLRGKAATFEVVLSSEDQQDQQFALYCEFAGLGQCGRKRFQSKPTPESYIFDVLINDAPLNEGENAYIAINTDISANGRLLNLFSIRVRTGA